MEVSEGGPRKDAPLWHNLRMEPEADAEDDNCEAVKESRARPISFELHPDANPDSRQRGVKRFAPNPLPNWGPKMKAHATQADMDRKRKQNQGKYTEGGMLSKTTGFHNFIFVEAIYCTVVCRVLEKGHIGIFMIFELRPDL